MSDRPAPRAPGLARAAVRWLPAVAWMALIFTLSAQPGLALTDDPVVERPIRGVAHFAEYAVLGALIALGLGLWGRVTPGGVALAVGLAVLYAVSDEVHQSFVPERTAQVRDVVVDGLGATLGVALFALLSRARAGRLDGSRDHGPDP